MFCEVLGLSVDRVDFLRRTVRNTRCPAASDGQWQGLRLFHWLDASPLTSKDTSSYVPVRHTRGEPASPLVRVADADAGGGRLRVAVSANVSEQARAWLIVIVVYAAIAALIFGPVTHYESNPCQWWLDEHGDLHPRC